MVRQRVGWIAGLAIVFLGSCSSSSQSTGSEDDPPQTLTAPVVNATAADGSVTLSWTTVSGATEYRIYWSQSAGVDSASAYETTSASMWTHTALTNDTQYYYRVSATNGAVESELSGEVNAMPSAVASPYDPPWGTTTPLQTLTHSYDAGSTSEQNGAQLKSAIGSLQPGDRLEVESGTYSVNSLFSVNLTGTVTNPIWIVAAPGATPIITRPDANQNAINFGNARYVAFSGFEVTNGSTGIRLIDCQNVWIDRCHVHDVNNAGLSANTTDTAFLYLTRNEIHDTGGTAEGMYLGANNSVHVMRDSIIALNHIYDCAGSQGDGIEVKQGSYGNWIVENLVHDTQYPCILAYGTDGNAPNVIERNVCFNSGDNVMQVQGEAIVRNNLLMNGAAGFSSHDHQGQTVNLQVVHNTIINSGRAMNLSSWNGRAGMTLANNVVYSQNSQSIRFPNGSNGVELSGNVVYGSVQGATGGYVTGAGLSDFEDVAWDGSRRRATPAPGGALIATGDQTFELPDDLTGAARAAPLESGCLDGE